MTEPDVPSAPKPTPYWAEALAYGLCYYVAGFAVEWIWDLVSGDPFDAGATAKANVFVAVFFGLTMPLAMRWLRRRKA